MYIYMRCGSPGVGNPKTNRPAVCLSPWGLMALGRAQVLKVWRAGLSPVSENHTNVTHRALTWYKHGTALQVTSCWDACTSHQAKQPRINRILGF